MKNYLTNYFPHLKLHFLLPILIIGKCFSQNIVFVNKDNLQPVFGVSLYDCTKKLKAISNEKGNVLVSNLCFPLYAKNFEFENAEISAFKDTVLLSPKYKELSEFTVQPEKKLDLYNRILASSSIESMKNEGIRYGTYFQALIMINQTKGDTCFIDRGCLMAIKSTKNKKSKEYSLFCKNPSQQFISFKKDQNWDSSTVNVGLNLLPTFESNLDYDLSNVKKYQLKFEEKEIRYANKDFTGLKFYRKRNSNDDDYTTYFDDSKILYWNCNQTVNRPYDGQKIFMHFDKIIQTYSFDSLHYELNGILNKRELTFFAGDQLFKIYLVQGFKEESESSFETGTEVKNIKKYFESIPYSNSSVRYYVFE